MRIKYKMVGIIIEVEKEKHLELRNLAKENRRSLKAQVLFMLENALKSE